VSFSTQAPRAKDELDGGSAVDAGVDVLDSCLSEDEIVGTLFERDASIFAACSCTLSDLYVCATGMGIDRERLMAESSEGSGVFEAGDPAARLFRGPAACAGVLFEAGAVDGAAAAVGGAAGGPSGKLCCPDC